MEPFYLGNYTFRPWCAREDLNLHGLPHYHLKVARLPIPPLAREPCYCTVFREKTQDLVRQYQNGLQTYMLAYERVGTKTYDRGK